jgi:benzoyl-CoA reductase subunit C
MARESKGLSRVKEIYQSPSKQVSELKAEGKKIIGYDCIHVPLEMITSLGFVPYRLFGDIREPVTEADRGLPAAFCGFMRSLLDLALKDKFDFLDGLVVNHPCDAQEKMVRAWTSFVKYPYSHFIDIPSTVHGPAISYFRGQLGDFKKSLESFAGKELSPARLNEVTRLYNEQRALVRELYDLRKPDPPLISGTETLQLIVSLARLPVEEGNQLTREVINEVKERKDGPVKQPGRLLVWGSIIDDSAYTDMIEGVGANIVIDDICEGTRIYWADVDLTEDPLDGLAYRYLMKLNTPRTFREAVYGETRKDHLADLRARFGYLAELVREWNVNGAILQSVRYCDPHGYEVVSVKDYFDSLNIPSLYLEHDYTEGALAPLRTRVQGFLEVIGKEARE